jgi:tetratricopeptide (TPR) repeat protein
VAAGENPKDPEPCYHAARLYRQLGLTEEAVRCCMRSLEIEPDNAAFNYEMFLIREETDPPEERVAIIRNVVGKDPSHITYWLDYLALLYETRDLKELEVALEDAVRFLPDHPMLLYMKATVRWLEGKKDEGEKLFEEALKKYYEGHKAFLERFPALASIEEVNRLIHKHKP